MVWIGQGRGKGALRGLGEAAYPKCVGENSMAERVEWRSGGSRR